MMTAGRRAALHLVELGLIKAESVDRPPAWVFFEREYFRKIDQLPYLWLLKKYYIGIRGEETYLTSLGLARR